jgi:urease accessory protein UreH
MKEFWDFDIFASKFIVENETDRQPILLDSLLFTGGDKRFVDMLFGKSRFLLSAYWYSQKAVREKESVRNLWKPVGNSGKSQPFIGVTSMPYDCGLILKALSDDLEVLKKIQLSLWSLFRGVELGTKAPDLRMY